MNILQSVIMRPLPHEVELINQNTKITVKVNNSYLVQSALQGVPMQTAQRARPGGCHNDMLESSLLHIIICVYCTPSNTALFLQRKNLQNKGWRKEEYCSSFLYFLTPELQVWKKQRVWHLPFINSAETEIQALKLQEWKNTKFITCWHLSWKESVRDKSCRLGLSAQEKCQVPDLLQHE